MGRVDFGKTVGGAFKLAWTRFGTFARTVGPFIVASELVNLTVLGIFSLQVLTGPAQAGDIFVTDMPLLFAAVALGVVLLVILRLLSTQVAMDVLEGENPTLRSAWRRSRGRLWNLVGTFLLVGVLILLIFAVATLVLVASVYVGAFLVLVALGFTIVLALRWSLVAAVAVLETRSVRGNLARSAELTRGSKLVIFGVLFVVGAVSGTLANIVARVAFLGFPVSSLFTAWLPNQPPVTVGPALLLRFALFAALSILLVLYLQPVGSLATVIMYRDLRKDGGSANSTAPGTPGEPTFIPAPSPPPAADDEGELDWPQVEDDGEPPTAPEPDDDGDDEASPPPEP